RHLKAASAPAYTAVGGTLTPARRGLSYCSYYKRRVRAASNSAHSLEPTMKTILICGVAFLACACASAPPPTEQVAVGRKAVERAAGTPEVVQWAPTEIERARMKLAAADAAMARRDYGDARRLADEAEADARLAEARAGARKNDRALTEVREA